MRYFGRLFRSAQSFVNGRSFSNAREPLEDSIGRRHDYLRTERCNLRCRYCMPEEGVTLTEDKNNLSLNEMKHLINIFVTSCGIKKIRLTGGEPTVDSKLIPILSHLLELKKSHLKTVAMTTNGLTLKARAQSYKDLGKCRGWPVNVHLFWLLCVSSLICSHSFACIRFRCGQHQS